MVMRYYRWVYSFLFRLQRKHPNLFEAGVPRGGSLGFNLAVILVTAPVWITAIVVYLVPLPSNLRYMLWTLLFITAIVLALRMLYVFWKRGR